MANVCCLQSQSPGLGVVPKDAGFVPTRVEPTRFTPRPAPPSGGFSLQVDLFVEVTYSDGYVTYGSLLAPEAEPPQSGWPLVVFVHQLGQSRGENLYFQQLVASQGYAVWNYDVRAHGQALLANDGHPRPGSTLWGPHERLDLAEQLAFVAQHSAFAGVVDATRIGVVGKSQGAAHAWLAAAWAGTEVGAPGRPDRVFPDVQCVAAFDLVPDTLADWLRGGVLFSSWFVELISGGRSALPIDDALVEMCREGFLTQGPAALREQLVADGRAIATRLAISSVPVLYSHAYLDDVDSPLLGVEAVESRSARHCVILGGVGHGVPSNLVELSFRRNATLRWLHRFLWDEPNDIDAEPSFVLAERPLSVALAANVQHAWCRSHLAGVRPVSAATIHLLGPGGSLGEEFPGTVESAWAHRIHQQATGDLIPREYLDDQQARGLDRVLREYPLAQESYAMELGEECQLACSPVVHLSVVPQNAEWMLAASLTVQVDEDAPELLLAANAVASRSSTPGEREQHRLRLPPVAARFPAGAIVRLHLRNLWLRDPPMRPGLEVAPVFSEFAVDVLIGPADVNGSWLELPLQPVAPRLVADRTSLKLALPASVSLQLRAGSALAGCGYFTVVGVSGQTPPTRFMNVTMPIAFDWLVAGSAGGDGDVLTGGSGLLDRLGQAAMSYDLSARAPLSQALNGQQLTFAAFVWSKDGKSGAASNPWDVMLR